MTGYKINKSTKKFKLRQGLRMTPMAQGPMLYNSIASAVQYNRFVYGSALWV